MGALWVPFVKLVDVIGEESATALCAKYGGVDYAVPKKPNTELIEIIGDDAMLLCAEFPGIDIVLPNTVNRPPTKKDSIVQLIEKLRAEGVDPKPRQIALLLGCTKRHVESVMSDTTSPEEKLKLRLKRSKNAGVHRLPICVMDANGIGGER